MRRADVEEQWLAMIHGRRSVADVHSWAEQQMKCVDAEDEPFVLGGLQSLHGVSGARFTGSSEDVRNALAEWRSNCADYDADPRASTRRGCLTALAFLKRHHPDRLERAVRVFIQRGYVTEQDRHRFLGPAE